jgi:riboflavin synthase alpha subunit
MSKKKKSTSTASKALALGTALSLGTFGFTAIGTGAAFGAPTANTAAAALNTTKVIKLANGKTRIRVDLADNLKGKTVIIRTSRIVNGERRLVTLGTIKLTKTGKGVLTVSRKIRVDDRLVVTDGIRNIVNSKITVIDDRTPVVPTPVPAPTPAPAPPASGGGGSSSTTPVRESSAVTFAQIVSGQSVTVAGLTLTATGTITAANVAAGFASLTAAATTGNAVDDGSWSGTLTGFSSGTVTTNTVTFTSTTTSGNVTDISISTSGATNAGLLTATTTQGVAATTESSSVVFEGLTAGQSVTVAGLTLTATATIADNDVAAAFASLAVGATGTAGTGRSWNGTLTGFSSGAASTATVVFTSSTSGVVDDIAITVDGTDAVADPTEPEATTTPGAAAVTESASVVFEGLISGQSVTVAGLTLTATGTITAAEVAVGFESLAEGATTGNPVTDGTWSGALTDFLSGSASSATVVFTSDIGDEDVEDIAITVDGADPVADPTAPVTTTTQGLAAVTESASVVFEDLISGQSVTVAGLTLIATGTITADDVAAGFALLQDGVEEGNVVANGTWDGTLTGFSSGAASTATVIFTSGTPNTNVTDISITVDGTAAGVDPTAPAETTTQGVAATTESASVVFQNLTAGQSVTVAGLTLTATGTITAAEVAAGFASLAAGATTGNPVTGGTWSGTLAVFASGTVSTATVVFTSSTAGVVTDISVTGKDAAPTTPTVVTTQGA